MHLCVARDLLLFGRLCCYLQISIILRNRTKDQRGSGRECVPVPFWRFESLFANFWHESLILSVQRWLRQCTVVLCLAIHGAVLTAISLLYQISCKRWSLMAIGYQKGLCRVYSDLMPCKSRFFFPLRLFLSWTATTRTANGKTCMKRQWKRISFFIRQSSWHKSFFVNFVIGMY